MFRAGSFFGGRGGKEGSHQGYRGGASHIGHQTTAAAACWETNSPHFTTPAGALLHKRIQEEKAAAAAAANAAHEAAEQAEFAAAAPLEAPPAPMALDGPSTPGLLQFNAVLSLNAIEGS